MEKQQNSIDEIFRQSLGDYQESPPAAAWGEIASRLDADENHRRGFFMRWPWMVMLLLLIAGGTWFTIAMHINSRNRLAQREAATGRKSSGGSGQSATEHSTTKAAEQTALPKENTSAPTIQKPNTSQTVTHSNTPGQTDIGANPTPTTQSAQQGPDQPTATPTDPITPNQPQSSAQKPHNRHKEKLTPSKTATNTTSQKALPNRSVTQIPHALHPNVGSSKDATVSNGSAPHTANKDTKAVADRATRQTEPTEKHPHANKGKDKVLALQPVMHKAAPTPQAPIIPQTALNEKEASSVAKPTGGNSTNKEVRDLNEAKPAEEKQSRPAPRIVAIPAKHIRMTGLISETLSMVPESTLAGKPGKPSTDKQNAAKERQSPNNQTPPPPGNDSSSLAATRRRNISISFAAMGGYEGGLMKPAPGRVAVAARLQYHINKVFAIGIQPAYRFGSLASTAISDTRAYQRTTTHDTTFTSLTTSPSIIPSTDTLYNYRIQEAFDSIVVNGTSVSGKFWEIELPLILSYKISSAFTLYGGPSFNFGGKLPVASTPDTKTYTTIRRDTLIQSQPVPASASVNYFGTHSSLEPYSAYKPATVQDPASMRLGYLFGLTYERKRFLLDASIHQQLTGYSNVNNSLQKLYSSPYLRLSLGFYLVPQKTAHPKPIE